MIFNEEKPEEQQREQKSAKKGRLHQLCGDAPLLGYSRSAIAGVVSWDAAARN